MYRSGRLAVNQADLSPTQDGAEVIQVDQPCSTKTAGTICMIQELTLLIVFAIQLVAANLPSTLYNL